MLKPNTGIVKSRKGGKGKKASNSMSFNELMQMSALNKNKGSEKIEEQDDEEDDDLIQERDDEDSDEEQKIEA